MTNILRLLNRPEYVLCPQAIVRRVSNRDYSKGALKTVRLYWGLPIEVDTGEGIGLKIYSAKVLDVEVTEAIFRLIDTNDIFLDVGANIGYMSSAAIAAGAKKIIAFEPHPNIFSFLARNILLWSTLHPQLTQRIIAYNEAISDNKGTAILRIPNYGFSTNHGISTLEIANPENVEGTSHTEILVEKTSLAGVIGQCGESIGVLKIDIEGHEFTALSASLEVLKQRKIRDIIFEDYKGINSEVSSLLSSCGYSVFALYATLFGPTLLDGKRLSTKLSYRMFAHTPAVNFLATLDPERACHLFSDRGFRCLQQTAGKQDLKNKQIMRNW